VTSLRTPGVQGGSNFCTRSLRHLGARRGAPRLAAWPNGTLRAGRTGNCAFGSASVRYAIGAGTSEPAGSQGTSGLACGLSVIERTAQIHQTACHPIGGRLTAGIDGDPRHLPVGLLDCLADAAQLS
jgi:hypothetical protein